MRVNILNGAGFDEWSCEVAYSDLKAAKFLKVKGFEFCNSSVCGHQ